MKGPFRTKSGAIVGSYAKYDLLAAGDTHSQVAKIMEGDARGPKPSVIKSFIKPFPPKTGTATMGVSLTDVIAAPFAWLAQVIERVGGNTQQQAPATLPGDPDDPNADPNAATDGSSPDGSSPDGSSPDGSSPDGGDGAAPPPADTSNYSPDAGTDSDGDDMSGTHAERASIGRLQLDPIPTPAPWCLRLRQASCLHWRRPLGKYGLRRRSSKGWSQGQGKRHRAEARRSTPGRWRSNSERIAMVSCDSGQSTFHRTISRTWKSGVNSHPQVHAAHEDRDHRAALPLVGAYPKAEPDVTQRRPRDRRRGIAPGKYQSDQWWSLD